MNEIHFIICAATAVIMVQILLIILEEYRK